MSEGEVKRHIKSLTKARAGLAKDDRSGRVELSRQIKAAKQKLSKLNAETAATPTDEKELSVTRAYYTGSITVLDESLDGWNEFIAIQPASHYHSAEWRDVFKNVMKRELHYLSARSESNEILGVLPIAVTKSKIFGRYGVSLPYTNYGGPIGIAENVEMALIKSAFKLTTDWGLTHVELRDTKAHAGLRARTDKIGMLLNRQGMQRFADLLQSQSSKVRSQIKKSQSNGMTFQFGGTELLTDFYRVFAHHMRDLGTPVYGKEFFTSILAKFPEDTKLVVGYSGASPVSCAFLLVHNNEWEIPWASTLRSANRINANMALYASILEFVIQRGGTRFDFGRSTINAPTHKFKKQWGAIEVPCYWYYSDPAKAGALTTSSKKYAMAIKAWQHLPIPVANLLGPRLVRNLP